MVVIRLARGGSKKRPFYSVVVADSRSKRDGRYIERIGIFNPIARGSSLDFRLDLNRVDYWITAGAQLTATVNHLVTQQRKRAKQEMLTLVSA